MFNHGQQVVLIKPEYKHLYTCHVPYKQAESSKSEDHWVNRTAIRRSGYWVVRYNGHYHSIGGGIRTPLCISAIKQGKC